MIGERNKKRQENEMINNPTCTLYPVPRTFIPCILYLYPVPCTMYLLPFTRTLYCELCTVNLLNLVFNVKCISAEFWIA